MNDPMTVAFTEIPKEQVGVLDFPDNDVLTSMADRKERKAALERAMALGNLEKIKFKILFEDSHGKRYIHTTVWGVTDERIILKGGMTIPTHRIIRIH